MTAIAKISDVAVGQPRSGTTIQSVSRACRVLLAIAESSDGMLSKEVAAQLDLALPTTYHILTTLQREGFISKDHRRRHVLGPAASTIAAAMDRQESLPLSYRRGLRQLAEETGETAYLCGWRAGLVSVLDVVEGPSAVRVAGLAVGYADYPHARAAGKLLLAYAPKKIVHELLTGTGLPQITVKTITSLDDLEREFDRIRATGVSTDSQEFQVGVDCVAMPILRSGAVGSCLSVSVPSMRFAETRASIETVLRAITASIS